MITTSISTNSLPWSELVAQAKRIARSVSRGAPNPQDFAQDVAGTALLKAVTVLPTVAKLRSPGALVTRITKNTGLDDLRYHSRWARLVVSAEDPGVAATAIPTPEPSPEEILIEKRRPFEDRRLIAIREALETLRSRFPKRARVVEMLDMEEMTVAEVARRENETHGNIHQLASRGREDLRNLMTRSTGSVRGSPALRAHHMPPALDAPLSVPTRPSVILQVKRVIIQQVDLDTCLTALLLGVEHGDHLVVARERAEGRGPRKGTPVLQNLANHLAHTHRALQSYAGEVGEVGHEADQAPRVVRRILTARVFAKPNKSLQSMAIETNWRHGSQLVCLLLNHLQESPSKTVIDPLRHVLVPDSEKGFESQVSSRKQRGRTIPPFSRCLRKGCRRDETKTHSTCGQRSGHPCHP